MARQESLNDYAYITTDVVTSGATDFTNRVNCLLTKRIDTIWPRNCHTSVEFIRPNFSHVLVFFYWNMLPLLYWIGIHIFERFSFIRIGEWCSHKWRNVVKWVNKLQKIFRKFNHIFIYHNRLDRTLQSMCSNAWLMSKLDKHIYIYEHTCAIWCAYLTLSRLLKFAYT